MQRARMMRISDQVARIVFLICAILVVAIIISVFYFIGSKAFKVFYLPGGSSVQEFFTSTHWDPTAGNSDNPAYGAWGLILGSIIITLASVLIATPLSFGMALFMAEVTPRWLSRILQPLLEVFTGMPSVVIGFLGLTVLVPWLGTISQTLGYGYSAAIIVLVVMIIPTIVSVSIDAIRAVPSSVREASLALGSSKWQTMSKAIIPAASTGLATAVVLGMARAIGETLAVAMVLGGQSLPDKLYNLKALFFTPTTNITQAILSDFGETSGIAQDAYWTLAFLLLVISLAFICVSRYLASRSVYK
ncbi:phosphate transport system permease protein [Ktedonobacter sp. SOSP1-52]|nr:phosphate transport system permease protein [Ktedonobacter sp. SOSP1-52]